MRSAQRDRMLVATAEVMARKGYVATSVAAIIEQAGVSRETFYQQFSSKLDCFTSAFDAAAELLLTSLEPLLDGPGTPVERFERVFAGYLGSLAEHPDFARMFLVEVYAAGAEAVARRTALQLLIVDVVADVLEVDSERGRFACELLVSAIASLVTSRLVEGDLAGIGALQAPVVELVRRATAADLTGA
ncbi:TetR/AcrR family transcriptional regulator [Aquihabitans sp. G128]|uniref:TetR/AcrR family transcriptional regulator n=1 Tax=Aquihabitans sp. G128 TaxID=2849779 RepID=UPI001C24C229|nr:TetR/AcrR family transcriptional regulator [Aquihabitans sp. G128]QXC62645.1 TetR/AcrR family transcriptional regulator [Aquihabitans sp. G128]